MIYIIITQSLVLNGFLITQSHLPNKFVRDSAKKERKISTGH